jgi:hypothetical protein
MTNACHVKMALLANLCHQQRFLAHQILVRPAFRIYELTKRMDDPTGFFIDGC